MNVRRLAPSDAEDYRAIRLSALRTAPDAFGSSHSEEAAKPLASHAERLATSAVFGADGGGGLVGMIGFRQQDGAREAHKGYLWGFYVEPGHRRRGIGAALVAAALEHARGVVEQLTLTVVQGNPAIALYRRFGFTIYGVEPRALKGASGYADEVLMALRL